MAVRVMWAVYEPISFPALLAWTTMEPPEPVSVPDEREKMIQEASLEICQETGKVQLLPSDSVSVWGEGPETSTEAKESLAGATFNVQGARTLSATTSVAGLPASTFP